MDRPATQRLLVLACSQTKRLDTVPLPAIDRYDGPAFRVLRRYLREVGDENLAVLILSAEHGLIEAARPIRDYDRKLTAVRADAMHPTVRLAFDRVLRQGGFAEAFVCAGRLYRRALGPTGDHLVPVRTATGGQGGKLTELHEWLRGRRPPL